MKNLEQLAKELFISFAKQETGVEANWDYLNKTRQLAWLEDVISVAEKILNELQEQVKPAAKQLTNSNSFAMGHFAGVVSERTQFITLLENYRNDLNNDLQNFMEKK